MSSLVPILVMLSPVVLIQTLAGGEGPTTSRGLFEVLASATKDDADAAHQRFRNRADAALRTHGVRRLGVWTPEPAPGAAADLRIYVFALPDSVAPDDAWAKLHADPEWARVREAGFADGLIVSESRRCTIVPGPTPGPIATRTIPDPSKDEILLLQHDLRRYDVVARPELPLRVYVKKSATQNGYQQYLSTRLGELKNPPKVLLTGTTLSGRCIGAQSNDFYVLAKDGRWRKSEGSWLIRERYDEKSGMESLSYGDPFKTIEWGERNKGDSNRVFFYPTNDKPQKK